MPFVEWFSENALGKSYFTNLNASSPSFISNREDINGTATLYSASGQAFIKLNNPAVMHLGDYVGISLPEATHLEGIAAVDTLWENYQVLWSANGKQWIEIQKEDPVPTEYVKYIVFVNPSTQAQVLNLSKTEFSLALPTKLKPASATTPQYAYYEGHTEKYLIDGDYTTWTCIKRNQQDGDAYTVKFRKATPINDVRICMGTENGDYMTAGLVQLSEDGNTWESIPIRGTTDTNYTLENEHNVVFSPEMTYCDFDGQGKSAKFVRLYLSTPKTSNWLRIYEIEVNGRQYEEAHQGLATDASGITIPKLTDADGATCYALKATTQPGEILWHFRSQQHARTLSVYLDGGKQTDAKVSITTDGEQWEELGDLTGYVSHFDLTSYPLAVAAKISWTSKAPLLYEISEETDNETAIVTRIEDCPESPEHSNYSEGCFDLSGRKIVAGQSSNRNLPKGIYILDGKKVVVR